jgi:hypothetical protein
MPLHRDSRRQGIGFVGVVVIVAVLVIGGFLAVPTLFPARRGSSERCASTSLKTLSSAEADFRANDRDWNHVNDFWTANVSGLYTMTPADVKGAEGNNPKDPSIKLIELSVASADADGAFYPAGGENLPLSTFSASAPKSGHWYVALTADLSVGKGPEGLYAQDTKGTPPMGRVHHTSAFGFIAFPDSSSTGKYVWMVNENNTIFRSAATGPCRQGTAVPPGLSSIAPAYRNWPDDNGLKFSWAKID